MSSETALLANVLLVGAVLFGLGAIGLISRRNMIVMFLSVEMMLQGVGLSLVGFGRYHRDFGGQMLVVFIIVVAACEAAVALAMLTMLFRARRSLDVAVLQELREVGQPPLVAPLPDEEPPAEPPAWPRLAPAGRQPELPRELTAYRPEV